LGAACLGEGDLATARGHLEEALERARSTRSEREITAALNMLAQLHRVEGSLDTADLLFQEVIVKARGLGDVESIAIGLLNRAMIAVTRRAPEQAAAMLCEILMMNAELGSKAVAQSLLEASCGLAALREEWTQAARFYGAAESLSAQTGIHRDPADNAYLEPWVAATRRALDATAYAAAETQGRGLACDHAMTQLAGWAGGITAPGSGCPPR
jgi:tetratricopeptide (TPR) repeat protein